VPAEVGRLRRRLRARDRWFLAAVAALLVAGAAAAVPLSRSGGPAPVRTDCVSKSVAGVLGYGTYRYCGAAARPFCRRFARGDAKLAAECRRLGFAPG
jgi:hypothetical protein